ncbi:hypothetical protein NDU88_001457 [Pleurodeles waltl]|uniref:Uncharacterized protein n=1 Tax=Pleurodeles waltl TaxID=8319 RepID=A0AAV7UST6_PLEWA|nr:hypothetical protein NDU88_001457 [Pleurodeles waltl]
MANNLPGVGALQKLPSPDPSEKRPATVALKVCGHLAKRGLPGGWSRVIPAPQTALRGREKEGKKKKNIIEKGLGTLSMPRTLGPRGETNSGAPEDLQCDSALEALLRG